MNLVELAEIFIFMIVLALSLSSEIINLKTFVFWKGKCNLLRNYETLRYTTGFV